ncbi:MAG: ADOP family duplicated permease [Vicinamibacterales bacterium]
MRIGEWFRRRGEQRMDAELQFHLDALADDYVRQGVDRAEAERLARRDFGPLELAKDECRDGWTSIALEHLARDVRFGLRGLARNPGFAAAAILTLALGVGANTAVYQLVDAVRLRPLPVAAPGELAIVDLADLTQWRGRRASGYPVLSNPLWEAFRDRQSAFAGVLAWAGADFEVEDRGRIDQARGLFVSGSFFDVLGVGPTLGRVLSPADDEPGCVGGVAVASDDYWRRRLGADPGAVGREVRVNGQPVTLVGVTPPGFMGAEVGRSYDLAVPICAYAAIGRERGWLESRGTWWLTVMGRRPAGRPLSVVNAALASLSPGLFEATVPPGLSPADAREYARQRLSAAPGAGGVSALRTRYGNPLLVLLGATGLILLLACANLANLILARASAREREFGVRLAVGASRRRLVSQLLVESGLLAAGGAAAGLAVAVVSGRLLVGLLGDDLALDLRVDGRMLAFVAGLASLLCLGLGLVPAWRASRVAALDAVTASGRGAMHGRGGTRLRQVLVVAQVALSFVLLFGALLFTRTLRNLEAVDAGFEAPGVVAMRLDVPRQVGPDGGRAAFTRAGLEALRAIPGIAAAAEVRHVPLGGTGSSLEVWPDGGGPAAHTVVRMNATSEGFLDAMRIPLLAGRDFTPRDSAGAPLVAIVNETLVARLGLPANPVGTTFRAVGPPSRPEVVFEVVGLVPDTKFFSLREDALPIVFASLAQIGDPRAYTDYVVRPDGSASGAVDAVRRAIARDARLAGATLTGLDQTVRDGLVRERLMAALSAGLGGLAIVIAAVGLYGVLSYLVARRTNEIGIRMALGAGRPAILSIVLGRAAALLAVGLSVGAPLALGLAGFAESLVFGLRPWDPGLVAGAGGLLAAVALLAGYLPARRAAMLDPLAALRVE